MELRFYTVDIVRQLRGDGGVKAWMNHPLRNFRGSEISPSGTGWARRSVFSELSTNGSERQLTGDWLVTADVWCSSRQTLVDFDVRDRVDWGTIRCVSGYERVAVSTYYDRWRLFYRHAAERPALRFEAPFQRGNEVSPELAQVLAPDRGAFLGDLMDNEARELLAGRPPRSRGGDCKSRLRDKIKGVANDIKALGRSVKEATRTLTLTRRSSRCSCGELREACERNWS
ncbi:hypothetical protein ACHAPT_005018 [Fusarium lateritium]